MKRASFFISRPHYDDLCDAEANAKDISRGIERIKSLNGYDERSRVLFKAFSLIERIAERYAVMLSEDDVAYANELAVEFDASGVDVAFTLLWIVGHFDLK